MARLLIVSRSMALAMRLTDQHEVVEHPADRLDSLMADRLLPDSPGADPADAVDVLVLDLGDPILAVNTVNQLREADQAVPVLLVSGYQPEWEQVEAQRVEGVHVVPLPITRSALLEGIAALTGDELEDGFGRADETAPPAPVAADPVPAEPVAADPANPADPADHDDPAEIDDLTDDDLTDDDQAHDNPADDDQAHDDPADDHSAHDDPADDGAPAEPVDRSFAAPAGAGEPEDASGPVADGTVTEPDVADVSYASAAAEPFEHPPFDEQPPTGPVSVTPGPGRLSRWTRQAGAGNARPSPVAWADPPNGSPAGGSPAGRNPTGESLAGGGMVARRPSRLGNRPRKLQRHPAAGRGPAGPTGPVTDGFGPRDGFGPPTDPGGPDGPVGGTDLDRRLDAEAAALVNGGVAGLRTDELVRLLHDRLGELYGVGDTAQALADDVIERADADASAILLPDGPVWRVSGGVGLRPLERRLVLEETHWLITEIGTAGRAVLIDDTDIIRHQLAGSPLAAWRHLLAVPVPDVRGIAVLARGPEGGPFTDRDLSAVIAPVREAAALIAQAVETRRLARALTPLAEQDEDAPLRRPSSDR